MNNFGVGEYWRWKFLIMECSPQIISQLHPAIKTQLCSNNGHKNISKQTTNNRSQTNRLPLTIGLPTATLWTWLEWNQTKRCLVNVGLKYWKYDFLFLCRESGWGDIPYLNEGTPVRSPFGKPTAEEWSTTRYFISTYAKTICLGLSLGSWLEQLSRLRGPRREGASLVTKSC